MIWHLAHFTMHDSRPGDWMTQNPLWQPGTMHEATCRTEVCDLRHLVQEKLNAGRASYGLDADVMIRLERILAWLFSSSEPHASSSGLLASDRRGCGTGGGFGSGVLRCWGLNTVGLCTGGALFGVTLGKAGGGGGSS